jgi:glycosyltransferase 2 family protein
VIARPRAARTFQLALVGAGIALFVVLVGRVGYERLAADLRGFGFAILGVITFELIIDACNTQAWRETLPPGARVGFWLLFWVRQAGVAINQLTPTATVGGEVAKAMLLRPRLPASLTAASLVAARMSYALGQAALVLLGLSAVLARTRQAPDLSHAIIFAFALTVGGVLGFVWLQRRGIFATAVAALRRLGIAGRLVERMQAGGSALDGHLADFYRDRPRALVRSVLWHVVGQGVGLIQLFFILAALGAPASLATCLAIEAFALVLDSAVFLVPGRIGVQEAGRVLVFTTFGLGAATGLAVAVIVRLNQLAVAALGLVALATLSVAPPSQSRAR